MITQHSWMFFGLSFQKVETKMMHTDTISMAHLGARAFEEILSGEVVVARFFLSPCGYKAVYCRLFF